MRAELTCDEFDDLVLDVVYGDGDREARAAAEAHAASCERCGPLLARVADDRAQAALPYLDLPAGLEARVLERAFDGEQADETPESSPWAWLARWVSLAGGYAMRPQVAMAVLLMMMVGSSLLLLRARPAGPGAVKITQEGAPHSDEAAPPPPAAARAAAAPSAEAPTEAAREDAAYASAMDDYRAKRWPAAVRGFDIVASGGGANSGLAALYAARATRFASGCGAAIERFDAVASRYVGTPVAVEAMWDSAICYRELGNVDHARQLFTAMRRHASYAERAERELSTLEQREAAAAAAKPGGEGKPAAGAGRPATAAPRAAPAAPSKVRSEAY